MSISNNALIFYHTYTIESKKKSVLLAVSDSETKHPTAILRLNPTKET